MPGALCKPHTGALPLFMVRAPGSQAEPTAKATRETFTMEELQESQPRVYREGFGRVCSVDWAGSMWLLLFRALCFQHAPPDLASCEVPVWG